MVWDGIERRKNRMPPDNFTPNGAFEGYVYSKLETMEKRLDVLPCSEQSKRLNKCETDISCIKGLGFNVLTLLEISLIKKFRNF